MVQKIETDVDKLLLVLKMNKNFPIYITKIQLLLYFETKVVYVRPFLSSLPFTRFWKENFIYFGLLAWM